MNKFISPIKTTAGNILKRSTFISLLIVIMMMVSGAGSTTSAQVLVPSDSTMMAIDSIANRWNDWETLSISGKFKMAGLPLSPSVKIFMEKDSSIFISLRAPLMGEVGRAEIADSTLRIVNKMSKTYIEEPISKALDYYPGGVADLQNLLLGRAVIAGYGLLSPELGEIVELYAEEDGSQTLIAADVARLEEFNYGYSITPDFLIQALMVLPVNKPDVAVTLAYTYYEKGYDMEFVYQSEKRNYRATLELDEPQYEGGEMTPIKINDRYRRLDFGDFMKSF